MPEREENPFEDAQVAAEWIRSVEGEKGKQRDTRIYPYLRKWAAEFGVHDTVVEIGAGQGICSEQIGSPVSYIGVEPSVLLVGEFHFKEFQGTDHNVDGPEKGKEIWRIELIARKNNSG